MGIHKSHIMTADLKAAYSFLLGTGEMDSGFDVNEEEPRGKNRKRSVVYRYAGKSANPFSFIVNSGERADYHLFYIRHPKPGHKEIAEELMGEDAVNVNNAGEVTIRVCNQDDAERVWQLVQQVRLQAAELEADSDKKWGIRITLGKAANGSQALFVRRTIKSGTSQNAKHIIEIDPDTGQHARKEVVPVAALGKGKLDNLIADMLELEV